MRKEVGRKGREGRRKGKEKKKKKEGEGKERRKQRKRKGRKEEKRKEVGEKQPSLSQQVHPAFSRLEDAAGVEKLYGFHSGVRKLMPP